MKLIKLPEPEPTKPKLLGMRGVTNNGLQVVFDRPLKLNPDEEPSAIWEVDWQTLGEGIVEHSQRRMAEDKPE